MTEDSVKKLKTKDLLKLFFEKAQRSSISKPEDVTGFAVSNTAPEDIDLSLSFNEEVEMYIIYEELQLRAGEYDRQLFK
jgi:hypothetical protein